MVQHFKNIFPEFWVLIPMVYHLGTSGIPFGYQWYTNWAPMGVKVPFSHVLKVKSKTNYPPKK